MELSQNVITVGTICLGLGFGGALLFKGKLDGSSTLLKYLREQNAGYEQALKDIQVQRAEDNKEHAVEMQRLHGQVETFKETIRLKDETIARQSKIIENRNPELENFMSKMSVSLDTISQYMGRSTMLMANTHETLLAVDKHLKVESGDLKISATVTKQ